MALLTLLLLLLLLVEVVVVVIGWLVPNQPTSCGYRGYRSNWEAILWPMGYCIDAYTVEAIEPK